MSSTADRVDQYLFAFPELVGRDSSIDTTRAQDCTLFNVDAGQDARVAAEPCAGIDYDLASVAWSDGEGLAIDLVLLCPDVNTAAEDYMIFPV